MEHDYPAPIARWNYHPEIEIHHIRRSTGSYLIGDQVGTFGPGHVAVVGADIPHDWMSDISPGEVIPLRDSVIQVLPSWLHTCARAIPELHELTVFARDADRGIVYSGATAKRAASAIDAVGTSTGTTRIAHFFTVLDALVSAPDRDRVLLAPSRALRAATVRDRQAVDDAIGYVVEHLSDDVRLSEAARRAHMSEPTFSKLFKRASGMTYTELVRRLRIENACRLLERTDATVSDICQSVGYRNLANFNRQFRAQTGMTPSAYRRASASDGV